LQKISQFKRDAILDAIIHRKSIHMQKACQNGGGKALALPSQKRLGQRIFGGSDAKWLCTGVKLLCGLPFPRVEKLDNCLGSANKQLWHNPRYWVSESWDATVIGNGQ
jgi:hypothetical protein